MTDGTSTCRQCKSEVPPDATRCPACGYDPSPGILGTLAYWLALPFAAIGALLVLTAVLGTLAGALTVGEAVGGVFAAAVLFGPAWYVVHWARAKRRQVVAV